MRRSKVGIVVGSVSSRFMEAIPTDPDKSGIEDDFCFYCGKVHNHFGGRCISILNSFQDWDTLFICSGAHCGRVFHLECLREKAIPEGEWKCPICVGQKFMSLTSFLLNESMDVPKGAIRQILIAFFTIQTIKNRTESTAPC